MNRIFLGLGAIALLLMLGNLYLGITGGDYNGICSAYREAQSKVASTRFVLEGGDDSRKEAAAEFAAATAALQTIQPRTRLHMILGLLAGIVTVLLNSLCVTYFIGTGRWCKEVSDTYGMDESFLNESRRIKRQTFPWSILGFVVILVIVAVGAAADPGNLRSNTARWVTPHLYTALFGVAIEAVAIWFQYTGIERNQALINRIMQRVRQIRMARGMPIEPAMETVG